MLQCCRHLYVANTVVSVALTFEPSHYIAFMFKRSKKTIWYSKKKKTAGAAHACHNHCVITALIREPAMQGVWSVPWDNSGWANWEWGHAGRGKCFHSLGPAHSSPLVWPRCLWLPTQRVVVLCKLWCRRRRLLPLLDYQGNRETFLCIYDYRYWGFPMNIFNVISPTFISYLGLHSALSFQVYTQKPACNKRWQTFLNFVTSRLTDISRAQCHKEKRCF